MSTSKKTKNPTSKATRKYQSKLKKPFMQTAREDFEWVRKQKKLSVKQLWEDCWWSDPYGSRWMPLDTCLSGRTLRAAKKVLREASLFDFKSEMRILEGKRYYEDYVINLHGARTRFLYSQEEPIIENEEGGSESAKTGAKNTKVGSKNTEVGSVNAAQQPSNDAKSVNSERLTIVSRTPQEHLKGDLEACEAEKIAQKARSFSCASQPQEGEIGIRSARSAELMVGEIGGGQAPHTPHAPPPPT